MVPQDTKEQVRLQRCSENNLMLFDEQKQKQ